jgi:hypothetical protein
MSIYKRDKKKREQEAHDNDVSDEAKIRLNKILSGISASPLSAAPGERTRFDEKCYQPIHYCQGVPLMEKPTGVLFTLLMILCGGLLLVILFHLIMSVFGN